ncbi:hypothetical protein CXF76_13435 [Pseudoalteromonas sp. 78C3]|nr:hypothetical protein CXF76_13435 [Pseudoalteromonas sp. 78C3]
MGYQLLRANLLSICNYLSKLSIIGKAYRDEFFIKLLINVLDDKFTGGEIAKVLSEVRSKHRRSSIDSSYDIVKLDAPIILLKYREILNILGKISHYITMYITETHIEENNKLSTFNTDLIIELTNCISTLPPLFLNNFLYGWNGFSTGEFAKLNIFSELYNYIHDQKNHSTSNHLII